MPTTVMIPNVQDLVPDQTQLLSTQAQGQWNYTDDSFWANYHNLTTLNDFTETMIAQYPDLVKRVSMGHTYEGREVFGMSIHGGHKNSGLLNDEDDDEEEMDLEEMVESWWSWLFGSTKKSKHNKGSDHNKKNKKNKKKKAIIIHGGQHARGKGKGTIFISTFSLFTHTTTSLLYREWIACDNKEKQREKFEIGRAVIDVACILSDVVGPWEICPHASHHTNTPETKKKYSPNMYWER